MKPKKQKIVKKKMKKKKNRCKRKLIYLNNIYK